MVKQHNAPVTMQIYLGSGDTGLKLRENIQKKAEAKGSLSEFVVELLKKADPTLFRGIKDGSK